MHSQVFLGACKSASVIRLPRYASLARKIVNKPTPARSPAAVLREEARILRADAGAVSPH